ncbi:MAG: hypothetical protein P4N59_18975 [Negativicutes bacterium]|nr:hypothetical protein [Negativicutes bacterium]
MFDKTLMGYLSIIGEVGLDADPGTVSQDSNDSGGWSYGLYQLASAPRSVQAFITALQQPSWPEGNGYGAKLAAAGDPNCDQTFVNTWQQIAADDPSGFGKLQDDYVANQYYVPAATILESSYGFDISGHSLPLKQVLFANAVQHGPKYGAEAFQDGADSIGQQLNALQDADIIAALYNNKINDPYWSNGAQANRPGLIARWANERDMALALLG